MTVQDEVTQQGIVLTDAAAAKVSALVSQEGRDDLKLRVAVQPGGCSGLRYQLYFDERSFDGDVVRAFGAVEVTTDSYSYTWLVCHHSGDDVEALVTDLHAVNSSLVDGGFGPQLLCTLVAFRDDSGRRLAIVYLFKRGTFYPFAPLDGERRDNALELQVRGQLGSDLKIEPDLSRWFPVWGAPGL